MKIERMKDVIDSDKYSCIDWTEIEENPEAGKEDNDKLVDQGHFTDVRLNE